MTVNKKVLTEEEYYLSQMGNSGFKSYENYLLKIKEKERMSVVRLEAK